MKLFSRLLIIAILFLGMGSNLFGQQAAMQMPALALVGDDDIAVPIPASLGAYYEHLRAVARSGSRDVSQGIRIPGFNQSILRYFVLLLDHYKELQEKRVPKAEIIAHMRHWIRVIPDIHEYAVELMRLGRMWDLPDQLVGAIEWYVINGIVNTIGLAQFMREEEIESFLSPELSETHFTFEEQLHLLMQLDIGLQTTEPLQSVLLWLAWLSRDPELQTNPEVRQTYILALKKVSEFIANNIKQVLLILPDFDQIMADSSLRYFAIILQHVLLDSSYIQFQFLYSPQAQEKRITNIPTSGCKDGAVLDENHIVELVDNGKNLQIVDLQANMINKIVLPNWSASIRLAQYPYVGVEGFIMADALHHRVMWQNSTAGSVITKLIGGAMVFLDENAGTDYLMVAHPNTGQLVYQWPLYAHSILRQAQKLNEREIVIDYVAPDNPYANVKSIIVDVFTGVIKEIRVPDTYERRIDLKWPTKIIDQNHVAIQGISGDHNVQIIINTQTLAVEDTFVIAPMARVAYLEEGFILIQEQLSHFLLYHWRSKQMILSTTFYVGPEIPYGSQCLLANRYLILFNNTSIKVIDIKSASQNTVGIISIPYSAFLEKINKQRVFIKSGQNDIMISFPELGTITDLISFIKEIILTQQAGK